MEEPLESVDFISLLIVATFSANYLFMTYLKTRQIKKIRAEEKPRYHTPEDFQKVKSYNLDKLYFSLASDTFKLVTDCLVIKYRLLVVGLSKFRLPYSILNQTLFYVVYSLFLEIIGIPFDLFFKFYIEAKHGFNTMTLGIFFTDIIKNMVLSSLVVFISFSVILLLMSKFVSFYLYAFIFLVAFQLIMVLIYPDYIQPIFNKFIELEESLLKKEIEKLAKQLNFKVNKIFKMDGSTRSHHSNAYFIGLFKEKRVVLFDTLLEKMEDNQVLAIMCHELGHAKLLHIPKQLILTLVAEFAYLYLFNLSVRQIKYEDIIKIIYFIFISSIVDVPLKLMTNSLCRRWERQADSFAVKMGYGKELGTALIKLHKDNKSLTTPDSMYSMFNYSHPTLEERLEHIEDEMRKSQ